MTVISNKESKALEFLELSSSGLPEGRRIPDGSTCLFTDSGDRYISFLDVWDRDPRYPSPAEAVPQPGA